MNDQVGYGGAKFGGKTLMNFTTNLRHLNPELADLFIQFINGELTMPETQIGIILKDRMETFESSILEVAEKCYEEMSLKEMYLVERWYKAAERNNGDVWVMLAQINHLVDSEKYEVAKYALAGLWYYHQSPDGIQKEEEKDGHG